MRKYQSIWNTIKTSTDSKCVVASHPSLHRRIKKAVCKEKYKDIGYKVQWDIAGYAQPELEISFDPANENVIIFKLLKPITVGEL